MDASQYKDYVLVLLFVKYVSDKAVSQKGYLLDVPKGGSFADMVALNGDKEIGDKMNKIIARLAEANDLKGVIDVADFNDADKLGKGREMVDRLSNLVAIFTGLNFGANRAEGDDLLGDAYEYLMRHFATESGKSKGQFYTPAEVSRVMAKVVGVGSAKAASQTIHDPTCGSGSLLLKAHDEAKSATGHDLTLYGQEMDNATAALARMNMILHDCATAEIWQDNVLAAPHFKSPDGRLKTFDFVVANPPFSFKAWSNGFNPNEDGFKRFEFGIPPQKNGDLAFVLHILTCLRSTGKAAVNLPHGVLFRGGAEATIRREMVKRGYIKGIIGLPANLFYGTGIPACIIVLDKENAAARKGIFMIDASKGFIKDGNKNRLRAQDIHKIVDAFTRLAEIPRYSRMVSLAEIGDAKNDFNLNLPRYIDSTEPEDLQDIDAHLRGGIPNRDIDALNRYWQVISGVRATLFSPVPSPRVRGEGQGEGRSARYSQLKVAATDIKAAIFGHAEFTRFNQSMTALFGKWRKANTPRLRAIKPGDKPKALAEDLGEGLLAAFAADGSGRPGGSVSLVDPYDVYQHLMDYWAETMQDDVYLLVSDGWKAMLDSRPNTGLIPESLVIARYFAAEQKAIEKLEAEVAAGEQALEEMAEEHGGEDGLLAEAKNEKDKLTKASVKARLKELRSDRSTGSDPSDRSEAELLEQYLALLEKTAATGAQVKAAQEALQAKVAGRYGRLTVDEIKALVVDDKWLATIGRAVQGELDRVSQTLTGRIRQLAERYATPLPDITSQVESLAAKVAGHLQKMGFRP